METFTTLKNNFRRYFHSVFEQFVTRNFCSIQFFSWNFQLNCSPLGNHQFLDFLEISQEISVPLPPVPEFPIFFCLNGNHLVFRQQCVIVWPSVHLMSWNSLQARVLILYRHDSRGSHKNTDVPTFHWQLAVLIISRILLLTMV